MKKRINKKIILIMYILIIIMSNIMPISNAARLSGEVNIYTKSMNENLILYKGEKLLTIFNVYKNESKEYQASYNNPKEMQLIDEESLIWKVVANGYPYKTVEELGCANYEEAYAATQIAIYCVYCGHLESDYTVIEGNDASTRVYNAFKKILNDANNNTVKTDKNTIVNLIKNQEEWQLDSENNMIYKTYKIKTNFNAKKYAVQVLNFDNAIITDEKDNKKDKFNIEDNFKISLPISELNKSGEFEIRITTEEMKMPIYLGTSSENKYILTAPSYEEKVDTFLENYQENLTSINIKIQELNTKVGIENSQIKLLDSNKKLISTLTTNEQGKIFIEHLLPGKYYIEQISTEDGYNIYKKQVELNMDYNKVVNLTISNSPINIKNYYNKEENIEINEEIIEKNYNNEITDKNINNKTDITNENNTYNSYTENNSTTEKNLNNNTNTNLNTNVNTNINEKNNVNTNVNEKNNVNNNQVNKDNTTYLSKNTNNNQQNNINSYYQEIENIYINF